MTKAEFSMFDDEKIDFVARALAEKYINSNKINRTWETLYDAVRESFISQARIAVNSAKEFDEKMLQMQREDEWRDEI